MERRIQIDQSIPLTIDDVGGTLRQVSSGPIWTLSIEWIPHSMRSTAYSVESNGSMTILHRRVSNGYWDRVPIEIIPPELLTYFLLLMPPGYPPPTAGEPMR